MYFSRITPNPSSETLHPSHAYHNIYNEHQAIWKFFDEDPRAKRDFLYRQSIENGKVKYYLVSKRKPLSNSGSWTIQTKKYDPNLKKGQKVSFVLRANPVVTISQNGKKQRHDIIMHKKMLDRQQPNHENRPPSSVIVQEIGSEWLNRQGEKSGFKIGTHTQADGYRKHICQTPNKRKKIQFCSIDFEGILEVKEVELFNSALFNGIGKSKSFGCGLLLIKKI